MANITFDGASAELLQVRTLIVSPVAPISDGARVRVKRFNYTDTEALAAGSQIELVEIPGEAVVLTTVLTSETFTGATTVSIGTTPKKAPTDATPASLLAATAVAKIAAAGKQNVELAAGVTSVFATTASATLTVGDTFAGYVLYVINT